MDIKNKKWLTAMLSSRYDGFKETQVAHKDIRGSTIKSVLVDLYTQIRDSQGNPDALDKFYENRLRQVSKKKPVFDLLSEFAIKANIDTGFDYKLDKKDEDKINQFLYKIGEACAEDNSAMETLKGLIEDKFNGCFDEINEQAIVEQHNASIEEEKQRIIEELDELELDDYAEEMAKIKKAKQTEIEEICKTLNSVVDLGEELWFLLLVSGMSPYAPRFVLKRTYRRNSCHALLVGDISTAKTEVAKILETILPKCTPLDRPTQASLEGIATRDGIKEGELAQANNGTIIIQEFDKIDEMPILRATMDNRKIRIVKMGHKVTLHPNISFIMDCNPNADFFQNEKILRDQIPFKDGVLSRFDILIPLLASKEKNEIIINNQFFSDNYEPIDLTEISETLDTLSKGMSQVKATRLSEQQAERLAGAFKFLNRDLPHRPLLLLRDAETLKRLVNAIATMRFKDRDIDEKGVLTIEDEDIDKAVELWETIIILREKLHTKSRHNIVTPKQQVFLELVQKGKEGVKTTKFKEEILKRGITSEASYYRIIKRLQEEGAIIKDREYDGVLRAVVSD